MIKKDSAADNEFPAPQVLNGEAHPLRLLCTELHTKIEAFLQKDIEEERLRAVQAQCRHSLDIIHEALNRYPYISEKVTAFSHTDANQLHRLDTLSFSYNGGKDCLVLLVLYLSLLFDYPNLPSSLPSIYIPHSHPFPIIDAFVDSSSAHYHLSLTRQAPPAAGKQSMKEAFAAYLSSPSGRSIKAIFVGTRRTDPHGESLSPFDPTDRGWPPFMRIHPVLEWRYVEVWAFLRYLGVDYCGLYDEGYTSLGGVGDTHPNPGLRYWDAAGNERFMPAFTLEDDSKERLGRD
ncbi:MAG: hypothetical protein Q9163_000527 [Psora crenata]